MYRLHNIGIKGKVDWLVLHDKLKGKKVIISPWSSEGIEIYQWYTTKWGGQAIVVDDIVSTYNQNVISKEQLILEDNSVFLLSVNNEGIYDDSFLTFLRNQGVSNDRIFILAGMPLRGQDALIKCCEDPTISSVLDVGCGAGDHANIFLEYGKDVTGIDGGFSYGTLEQRFKVIYEEFEKYRFESKYDLVWCCHVLEHQLNPGNFICKLFECCNDNGKVAITVPYTKNEMYVCEGHVSVWNAGLLMYNIIQSGYSCRNAKVKQYADNVSVIVPKERIADQVDYRKRLSSREYFPSNMTCKQTRYGGVYFNGDIAECNWD